MVEEPDIASMDAAMDGVVNIPEGYLWSKGI